MLKTCPGYKSDGSGGQAYDQPAHALEGDPTNFGPGRSQCRTCYSAYARDWRAKKGVGGSGSTRRSTTRSPRQTIVMPDFRAPAMDGAEGEFVSDDDLTSGHSHKYIPMPDLIETWGSVANAAASGAQPFNLMFLGPSGSGKTEGASFLAALVGLPFTKIDCASMTDPESWFGTRELIESDNGTTITSYRPSAFVLAIEEPGVLLLDEVNRVGDTVRNILLPLLDGTHQVTNPLNGEVVIKHPRCFVIMSGNRGLNFTGTFAIDPALMTRSLVVPFDYTDQANEVKIAMEASGCDEEVASLFVRFAVEARAKAKLDQDFPSISTREVLAACKLVASGASPDLAARVVVINGASDEGLAASAQQGLLNIWTGIRTAAQATTRPCGVEHPTLRKTDDRPESPTFQQEIPVACTIEVPAATPEHPLAPQHRGIDGDGDPVGWA